MAKDEMTAAQKQLQLKKVRETAKLHSAKPLAEICKMLGLKKGAEGVYEAYQKGLEDAAKADIANDSAKIAVSPEGKK